MPRLTLRHASHTQLSEYRTNDGFMQSHEATIDSMFSELDSPKRLSGMQR